MGQHLNTTLAAFADELEKIALPTPGLVARGVGALQRTGGSIAKSLGEYGAGWKTTANRASRIGRGGLTEGFNAMAVKKTPELASKVKDRGLWTTGSHLLGDSKSLGDAAYHGAVGARVSGAGAVGQARGKIRGVAEELSRRGWTGQGNITKYMPVGQKGMLAGFPALSAPAALKAARDPNAPESASSIALGELGYALPAVLTAGASGGLALPVAGYMGATALGRKLDAMRQQRRQVDQQPDLRGRITRTVDRVAPEVSE